MEIWWSGTPFLSKAAGKFNPLLSAFEYSSADFFASAPDGMLHYTEDSPHSRFNIPCEASGTVQIISRAAGSVSEFHVKTIADTDSSLNGNFPGQDVFRLFPPQMSVNGQRYISWLICRHHGPKDHPVSGIRLPYRRGRIPFWMNRTYSRKVSVPGAVITACSHQDRLSALSDYSPH